MLSRVIVEGHTIVTEVSEADVSHLQLPIVLCEPPASIVHPDLNTANWFSRFYKYEKGPSEIIYIYNLSDNSAKFVGFELCGLYQEHIKGNVLLTIL